jgi:formylglycine-generating enzyme required for sulfatase activity
MSLAIWGFVTCEWLLSTSVGGILGNRMDAKTTDTLKHFRRSFNQRLKYESLPSNQDLTIAIQRSLLRAQNNLAEDCLDIVTGGTHTKIGLNTPVAVEGFSDLDICWLKNEIKQLKASLHKLEKGEYNDVKAIPLEVSETLFKVDQGLDSGEAKDRLRAQLVELIEKSAPAIYIKSAISIDTGLFERVSAFFADEIKTNQKVQALFQNSLLVQINQQLKNLSLQPIELSGIEVYLKEVSKKLPNVLIKLDELNKDFSSVKSLLESQGKSLESHNNDVIKILKNQSDSLEELRNHQLSNSSTTVSLKTSNSRIQEDQILLFSHGHIHQEIFFYKGYKKRSMHPVSEFFCNTFNVNLYCLEEIEIKANQYTLHHKDKFGNIDLIMISEGKFVMGSSDRKGFENEKPSRPVEISRSFYIGKYPITQIQWRIVAEKSKGDLDVDPSCFKGDNRPVECVSWCDAVRYCELLSRMTGSIFRLPSEAEWEYVCRADSTTPSPYGINNGINNDLTHVITQENEKGCKREEGSHNVYEHQVLSKKFLPNKFGLYHMLGNVSEWCQDHWHDDYHDAPSDARAWIEPLGHNLKVTRGGSWLLSKDCLRSSAREKMEADSEVSWIGFRILMEENQV